MRDQRNPSSELSQLQILLLTIKEFYGYDFTEYNTSSLMRRVRHFVDESGTMGIAELIPRIIRDPRVFTNLLYSLTINVTEMFRDPEFFREVRQRIVPYLSSYNLIKVWVAGCATGEEVYSLAILFEESGLRGRYRIYGTDINDYCLEAARKGLIQEKSFQSYLTNYHKSGGEREFSKYFPVIDDRRRLIPEIRDNLVFSNHNLVTDWSFTESQMVSCRNVLIYFKPKLIQRALMLFHDSLVRRGFLCLGNREQLSENQRDGLFISVEDSPNLYLREST